MSVNNCVTMKLLGIHCYSYFFEVSIHFWGQFDVLE